MLLQYTIWLALWRFERPKAARGACDVPVENGKTFPTLYPPGRCPPKKRFSRGGFVLRGGAVRFDAVLNEPNRTVIFFLY